MGRRNRHAFTLVELLVVIGVITILISILVPVLAKARRKAIVLASPIALTSFDQNRLHLIDPQGNYELPLTDSYGWFHARRPTLPMWSPSGTRIVFTVNNYPLGNTAPQEFIGIVNPMSGTLQTIPFRQQEMRWGNRCIGWYDEDHVIFSKDSILNVINIDTGQTIATYPSSDVGRLVTVGRGLPGKWITADSRGVWFVKADFTRGKFVWKPAAGEPAPLGFADVDAMGEWVAWSVVVQGTPKIAMKQVAAPTSAPPYYLTYQNRFFAQWTDEGQLLLFGGNGLTVIDKDGNLVREIKLPFQTAEGDSVSWRRYRH